jgi:Tol biopolymer transport system component
MRVVAGIISLVCVIFFVAISGCTVSDQGNRGKDPGTSEIASEAKQLADIPTAYRSYVIENPLQVDTSELIQISEHGRGLAYIEPVQGKYRVIHNGTAGKSYSSINQLSISPDGKRIAYVVQSGASFKRVVIDGWESPPYGDIRYPAFSPDGHHVVYRVFYGENSHLVIDNKERNEFNLLERVPVINTDSNLVAFAAKSPDGTKTQFVISDMALQNKSIFDGCGESFSQNDDKSRFTLVCSEGESKSIKVIDFKKRKEITDIRPNGNLIRAKVAADNKSVAYVVIGKTEQRHVLYNGKEEILPAGTEVFSDPVVLTDSGEVGLLTGTFYKASFYRAFQKSKRNEREYGYTSDLVTSRDGRHYAYIAVNKSQERRHIVVNGHEGPQFDKIIDPVFSPDGSLLVYRARQQGRRFIVVSDLSGNVVKQHQGYDLVFQPVFTKDGKSIGYGVLDGTELWWKMEKL